MEATRILALRHGETAWNADGRIQGGLDIELNARGRWQAARLAQALTDNAAAEQPIAAIYSSDLKRAWATAEPLAAACQLPLIAEPALRERAFGVFEGRTFDEIKTDWPEDAEAWRKRRSGFRTDRAKAANPCARFAHASSAWWSNLRRATWAARSHWWHTAA